MNDSKDQDRFVRLSAFEQRKDWKNTRPKDAATLILVDRSGTTPRVLMGRRHMRHKFLPGKFVFPGGRVDPDDWRTPVASDLEPAVMKKLMTDMKTRPSAARARAIALAAIRETYEEAGILIGVKSRASRPPRHPDWQEFVARGVVPALAGIRYLARAITPPRRPRRFDTRFLVAEAEAIGDALPQGRGPSDELQNIAWLSLAEARRLDLPGITHTVLEHLEARIADGSIMDPSAAVPCYFWRGDGFQRVFH